MGAWGYYDDENDSAMDAWCEIEDMVIDEQKRKIIAKIENKDEFDVVKDYVKEHKAKTYKAIKKWIRKFKETMNKHKVTEPEADISGVIVFASRFFNDKRRPNKLPEDFPESLRKKGLKYSKKLLRNANRNKSGWADLDERKKALRMQIKLFTKNE